MELKSEYAKLSRNHESFVWRNQQILTFNTSYGWFCFLRNNILELMPKFTFCILPKAFKRDFLTSECILEKGLGNKVRVWNLTTNSSSLLTSGSSCRVCFCNPYISLACGYHDWSTRPASLTAPWVFLKTRPTIHEKVKSDSCLTNVNWERDQEGNIFVWGFL